jgi:hypothetical protein
VNRPSLRLSVPTLTQTSRRWASGTSLALAGTTLAVLAVVSDGQPVIDVSLNDGSVWVTNGDRVLAGRINPAIRDLDLAVPARSADVDLAQGAYDVLLNYPSGEEPALQILNVAAGKASSPTPLPEGARAAYGAGTVAISDPASGAVWVRTMETVLGFTTKDTPSDLQTSPGDVTAVGSDGVVYVLNSVSDTVSRARIDDSGTVVTDPPASLDGDLVQGEEPDQVSIVGQRVIVVDQDSGRLIGSEFSAPVEATGDLRLQQPSSAAEQAYAAAPGALLRIGLADGATSEVSGLAELDGAPAAPVVVGGCVHGAWAVGDETAVGYVRSCPADPSLDLQIPIPGLAPDSRLVFRVNRDVVVLNDVLSGDSWLINQDSLERIDNWSDVDPNQGRQEEEDKTQDEDPDRTLQNYPPTANDDELGARPGRSTILPVTANDTDRNGDILTVTSWQGLRAPKGSTLSLAGKGTQLQLDLPADASGVVTFEYTIDDGAKGEPDTAEVRVKITPDGSNSVPEQDKDTEITLGPGATRSVFVMPDWKDPDGDDMVLTAATVEGGGSVEFNAAGLVTFTDDNTEPGTRRVSLTVSDAQDPGNDTAEGSVLVTVSDAKKLPPDLVPDRVVGRTGSEVLVSPLENDASPDGSDLTLGRVSGPDTVTLVPDPDSGTFSLRSTTPGSFYLDYRAYNDSGSEASYIRVDIAPAGDGNSPPVAVKDVGVLTGSDAVLVDLLQNDDDADGDVLVVQSLSVPEDSGLKAVLIDKQSVRVEATSALERPVSIRYEVTDGAQSAAGRLQILPSAEQQVNRPPVAERDDVTVRAGGIVNVPVLANDHDPDLDRLQVRQDEIQNPQGLLLFASGARLRLRAPTEPGTYRVVYAVRDPRGLRDSAQVVITVLPDTATNNRPPQPKPLIKRAFVGETLRIRLDPVGIDPDGDAVRIRDVIDPPRLGRIVGFGVDYVDYRPREGAAGTDLIRITVQDTYGAQASTDVRIGVASQSPFNQPPVALDDRIEVRPGRTIQYAVTANDKDPDADPLTLLPELRVKDGVTAEVSDGFITVTVPDEAQATVQRIGYTVTDRLGGTSSAVLVVVGDPEAPLWSPSTRDDYADVTEVLAVETGQTVEVDVLKNDGDIDGLVSDFRLESIDAGAAVGPDGASLVVPVQKRGRSYAYKVTDADDQFSYGFVFVPGADEIAPLVNPEVIPLEVVQGKSLRVIELADVVLTRRGRSPSLTVKREVSADHGDGSALVLAKQRLSYTPEPTFYGEDALFFEVTDGSSLNDPTGLFSRLTLPIRVLPSRNLPPSMRGTSTRVGQDAETTISLRGLADDPNPDDVGRLGFEIVNGPDDILDWSIDGQGELSLQATAQATDGVRELVVEVRDPAGATARASVAVTITASAQPLVSVRPIELVAAQGRPVTVDVSLYAVNPFPGEALLVEPEPRVVNGAAAAPAVEGTTITVRPTAVGQVTILYRINDHLGEASRAVTGRLSLRVLDPEDVASGGIGGPGGGEDPTDVIGKPEAPNRPTVEAVESQQVTLSWDEPFGNGGTITGYTVTARGVSQACAATVCTIGGLTNGTSYAFAVAATNEAGSGPKSAASESVTPADLPAVMAAPRVRSGGDMDQQLTVEWEAPDDGGSRIVQYRVRELSSGIEKTATGREVTFTGLTNGSAYRFAVRAETEESVRQGRYQEYSPASGTGTPFGKPKFEEVTVTASSPNDGAGGGGTVSVSWGAADSNGAAITDYVVHLQANGTDQSTRSIGPDPATQNYNVENGVDYRFFIEAINAAGTSRSDFSNEVNPFGRASAPRNVQLVPGSEGDRRATVQWVAPADDGGRPNGLEYRVTGGGDSVVTSSLSATLTNLPNMPTQVTVQVVTYNEGAPLEGGADSTTVRPFGPAGAVGVSATPGYRSVTFSFNGGSAYNGRDITGVRYRVRHRIAESDGTWSAWTEGTTGPNGSVTEGTGHGNVVAEVEAVAIPAEGAEGPPVVRAEASNAKTMAVSKGDKVTGGYRIKVVGGGFQDGPVTIIFRTAGCGGCPPPAPVSGTTNNGNFTSQSRIYGGPGLISVTISQQNVNYVWEGWVSGWDQ